MNSRIRDKVNDIQRYIAELAGLRPPAAEEYKASLGAKAICERYFEKIAEAITDLALLLIREHGLRLPEDDADAFAILAEAGIISQDLAGRLKKMKGMRNILAHQYDEIDDDLVFAAITTELPRDAAALVASLKRPR